MILATVDLPTYCERAKGFPSADELYHNPSVLYPLLLLLLPSVGPTRISVVRVDPPSSEEFPGADVRCIPTAF